MKRRFLFLCLLSLLPLTVCSCSASKKVTYEEFYTKTQEIEDHHYSTATLTINTICDLIHDGAPEKFNITRVFNYTWSDEFIIFVPDEDYGPGISHEFELSKTLKKLYSNKPQESEESKGMGFQYFINPFKVYFDYTETTEEKTVRTIKSTTYDKYGYVTNYLFKETSEGIFHDKPISGYQKVTYTVSYK